MLDSTTKRKIDTARDILVGKVPDPKSQIEQITLALIYKFMNDTDKLSTDIGGKASYFVGDYERFSWDNIIDPRLTGQERMNLYTEGLERMGRNPHLPELFRNVFKNAFLPFRNPETLNLFLEEIDGFQYDHSERLGDAYEYLLSIMSSQGDAGQFRTPRHIIDFIVQVVDPHKRDTILDPACGTAGFLISAIKHIIENNTKDIKGDLLSNEQRRRLYDNVVGYDISPDMRRLSLVNMFLHQINEPHIYEYDTLSSQGRWDDDFSCILANPPFMSPKGGIKPHERFGIKSSRSEVLFVDYIMEHLTIDGKAGVIVPEGVIFQSQKAFQNLRKKMVEDCFLWAVVSLPSGVFNPYSGVKTSILFFDRQIAKSTDKVLFVKIDADGYGLGAQRKPTEMNDLPEAYNNLLHFKKHYQELPPEERTKQTGSIHLAHTATKPDIKAQDYVLSANRYLIPEIRTGKWQRVKLGEVCEIGAGNSAPQDASQFLDGKYPFFRTSDVGKLHLTDNLKTSSDYLNDDGIRGMRLSPQGTILFPKSGASTFLNHRALLGIDGYVSSHLATIYPDSRKALSKFIYHILVYFDAKKITPDQSYPSLKISDISNIPIPLPPLDVQKEIVAEIESYQKIIDGAKQIIANWKSKIDIDPDWQIVKLGDITDLITKGATPTSYGHQFESSGVNFVKVETISENSNINNDKLSYISLDCHTQFRRSQLMADDILFSIAGTMGISAIVPVNILPANTNQALAIIRLKENVNPQFVLYCLRSIVVMNGIEGLKTGVAQYNLSLIQVSEITIPLPPLPIQQQIVSRIEEEQSHIESCKKLIEIYQSKIQDRINKVWEE